MFNASIGTLFKENQPIGTTGIAPHLYEWIMSSGQDKTCQNPQHAGDEHVGIYCVHGTADRDGSFDRVAERLLDKTLPKQIQSLHLPAFKGRYKGHSIGYFSQQLAEKIIANGHKKVILMGHSRGGLVIADFCEYLAKKHGIEVLLNVCICAPFGGSYLAQGPIAFFSDSIKEMQVDSNYLQMLNASIRAKPQSKYLFFSAEQDWIVPASSAFCTDLLDESTNKHIHLSRHGHLSIMSSHRIVSYIWEEISKCWPSNTHDNFPTAGWLSNHFQVIEDYKPDRSISAPHIAK